jgi:hypothetical protein
MSEYTRIDGKLVLPKFIVWGTKNGHLAILGIEQRVVSDGPWHDEPDHVDFEHAGLACILHRGPAGAWCGYVAVPPGHPWHGKGYDCEVDVHGGITYAQKCQGDICHVAKPGEPDDVWWLGFDCNHHGDLDLQKVTEYGRGNAFDGYFHLEYRTVDYARRETQRLANQARLAAAGGES